MKTICVFGDSVTWGAWDYELGGWVNRLRIFLDTKKEDSEILIYNLGIPGDTTHDVIKRFNAECKTRKPDTIIFAIGINDSHKPKISFEQFEENIRDLIEKAKRISSKIIFIGLTPVNENYTKEDNYLNEKIKKYDSKIKEICKKEKILFVKIFNDLTDFDFEDGLHPNSAGHKKIFEKVRDFLEKEKIV